MASCNVLSRAEQSAGLLGGTPPYLGCMLRWAFSVGVVALFMAAVASGSQGQAVERSFRLSGTPLELIAGRGSLWALTCDHGCRGEARRSVGRIVRIDPRRGRVVASATLRRPGALAIGAAGLYATDFLRDTVRRFDLRTLRVVRRLKLRPPTWFRFRDHAFLPEAVAVGDGAVWIVSDRGAVLRSDPPLRRVVATVRLPAGAFGDPVGGVAVGPGASGWRRALPALIASTGTRTKSAPRSAYR
jgi:hypothetical protein